MPLIAAPMLVFNSFTSASALHGNDSPDRALTVEMSDELIAPVAFTSNLKFNAVVV